MMMLLGSALVLAAIAGLLWMLRDELRPEPLTTPGGQYALYADSECGDVSCECLRPRWTARARNAHQEDE